LCTGDRLVGGKREAAELSVADFDGSRWKLVCTPDQPNIATVHLDVGGWAEIEKVGGRDVLESLYAGMVVEPAPTYKVAVSVDCDACQDKEATLEKMILLKRHLVGAPFTQKFEALAKGTSQEGPVVTIPWRDSGEAVYVLTRVDIISRRRRGRAGSVERYAIEQASRRWRKFGSPRRCSRRTTPLNLRTTIEFVWCTP
jgi:hypothetical protein